MEEMEFDEEQSKIVENLQNILQYIATLSARNIIPKLLTISDAEGNCLVYFKAPSGGAIGHTICEFVKQEIREHFQKNGFPPFPHYPSVRVVVPSPETDSP